MRGGLQTHPYLERMRNAIAAGIPPPPSLVDSLRVAYDPESHEYRDEGLRSGHERNPISNIRREQAHRVPMLVFTVNSQW